MTAPELPARIGPCEIGMLGKLVAVREPGSNAAMEVAEADTSPGAYFDTAGVSAAAVAAVVGIYTAAAVVAWEAGVAAAAARQIEAGPGALRSMWRGKPGASCDRA